MKKRIIKILLSFSLILMAVFCCYKVKTEMSENRSIPAFADGDEKLSSHCAVMIELGTDRVCYEKNADEKVPVASLTKIMTALVAIENLDSLEREFVFTEEIIERLRSSNSSMAGFCAQESVTAFDMLYGLMLPSGGEAAVGLAYLTAGSEEGFLEAMNDRAFELGMYNTRFSDVSGLDDAHSYSTAADMARLFGKALENPLFKSIVTTQSYLTRPTMQHPNGILLESTLSENIENYSLGDKVLGGKTGYTTGAGLCLATYAEVEGQSYILITLGAGDGSKYPSYHFEDAAVLYDKYYMT